MVGGFLKNCYYFKKKILEDAEVFIDSLNHSLFQRPLMVTRNAKKFLQALDLILHA
ncbi:unnamed protein product, partial [Ilex paraguariensis]